MAILSDIPHPHRKDTTLFTAHQLFGEFDQGASVLTFGAFLDRARLERARERDDSARLALGAYVVLRLVGSLLSRDASADSQEAFEWQRDAVRRHLDSLPCDEPELAHLSGIAEEVERMPRPVTGLLLSLTAFAYFLEHEGRLDEGLAVLALAAQFQPQPMPPAEFASTALFAARLNRLLARWGHAIACYLAAEGAAEEADDLVMRFRARLGRAAVHRGTGNLPLARSIVEDVAQAASEARMPEMQACAYTDIGAICSVEGKKAEGIQANYRAFRLTEDPLQRMRILGDLGLGLAELGDQASARLAFEIVLGSKTSFGVRTNAMLELMELESSVGDRMAFQRLRTEAEGLMARMPPSMLVDFHFKSGLGLARFGQLARGRDALRTGLALSENHKLNAWYFRIERALGRARHWRASRARART